MTEHDIDRPQKLSEEALDAVSGGLRRRAHDHLTDHNWQLEIEGITQGSFQEVSGLNSEIS